MTQFRFRSSAIRWIAVIVVATLLTAIGMWGEQSALRSHTQTLANTLSLCLLAPGVLVEWFIATVSGSGGIHSIGDFDWLGAPVSWVFYFFVGALIFCVRWKE